MSGNILIEPNIVGNYYGEYLDLIKIYSNNKRSSIFVKYLKVNKELSFRDDTQATYSKFGEHVYDIYDYTPLYNFGSIVNETAEQADLTGHMLHSFSSGVIYTIDEPNIDDLIIIEYNPNTKIKQEIFRVNNIRLSMSAKNTDKDTNWYELTLENAPIVDIQTLSINDRYVFLSTKETNVIYDEYVQIIQEVEKLDSLLETIKESFQDDYEMYSYYVYSYIEPYQFTGNLNDITINGVFSHTTDLEFIIRINSVGSIDTFQWSIDDGSSWSSSIDLSINTIDIAYGIKVKFGSITGHSNNDQWKFQCYHSLLREISFTGSLDDIFLTSVESPSEVKSYILEIDGNIGGVDTFKLIHDEDTLVPNVVITGSLQLIIDGIYVNFANDSGHTLGDKWNFNVYPSSHRISIQLNSELYQLLATRKHFNRSFINKYIPYGYKRYLNYIDNDFNMHTGLWEDGATPTVTDQSILEYEGYPQLYDMVKLLNDFTGF
jgi:hypothetical protein